VAWRRSKLPQRACILTGYGPLYIDEEYRILGVSEGWLVWDGHTRDGMGNLVNIYKHVSPQPSG
jgi:hypothetical protein